MSERPPKKSPYKNFAELEKALFPRRRREEKRAAQPDASHELAAAALRTFRKRISS